MDIGFDPLRLLADVSDAAQRAGALALDFFRAGEPTRARVEYKVGGSPVTEADYAVDRLLEPLLRKALPEAGFLSEERADDAARLAKRALFIVDPIDGTRAFVRGDPRWAVSVALVEDGQPLLGVLHLPALRKTFAAVRGLGATLNGAPIRTSDRETLEGARIAAPARMFQELRNAGVDFVEEPRIPSLAYRIAQVACGALDLGVASTNAHDWDIAAADLVLREAGGVLCDVDGAAPVYNAADPRHGALVAASARLIPAAVKALRALDRNRIAS